MSGELDVKSEDFVRDNWTGLGPLVEPVPVFTKNYTLPYGSDNNVLEKKLSRS
jgi:hypothetical protein